MHCIASAQREGVATLAIHPVLQKGVDRLLRDYSYVLRTLYMHTNSLMKIADSMSGQITYTTSTKKCICGTSRYCDLSELGQVTLPD